MLQSSRAWPDAEWAAAVARLRADGWVDDDGSLTPAGTEGRDAYERRTDDLAAAPWQALGDGGSSRLYDLARPWAKAIVTGGGLGAR